MKGSIGSYNEGVTLQESVENYRSRFGVYPEAVLADKIYRTRENIAYCKSRGIRLSGPKLGRPSKEDNKLQARLARLDGSERNAVEGKFGEGKRKYGLGLIRARLQDRPPIPHYESGAQAQDSFLAIFQFTIRAIGRTEKI